MRAGALVARGMRATPWAETGASREADERETLAPGQRRWRTSLSNRAAAPPDPPPEKLVDLLGVFGLGRGRQAPVKHQGNAPQLARGEIDRLAILAKQLAGLMAAQ